MMAKPILRKHFMEDNGSHYAVYRDNGIWQFVTLILVAWLMLTHAAYGKNNSDTTVPNLQITISSKAQVHGEKICLSDVADMSGANKTLIKKLGEISLGRSPHPGKERKFSKNRIHSLIMGAMDKSLNASIDIPESVCVQRAYQRISEPSLKQAFESYVASRLGGVETDISRFKIRGNNPLPMGSISLSPIHPNKKPINGAFSLKMAVCVDGKDVGRLTLSGWVNRYEPVVCTTRYISRGEILSNDDIVLKKINISKAPARLVRVAANAVGKQVKSSLKAGGVVRHNLLESPPMIEKGSQVKILATSGGIQVTTIGIAMDEGREGDQIKVENIASKKLIVGRVASRSTVEVLF
jgi:flagella basal body P-ring formation protein FlgA